MKLKKFIKHKRLKLPEKRRLTNLWTMNKRETPEMLQLK